MVDNGTRATPGNRGADAAARYRGDREASRQGPGQRARHVLEVEDVLLAAWVLGSEALIRRWVGEPSYLANTMMTSGGDGWMSWLRGLPPAGWVVVGLFFFILLTRGPEDTDRDVALGRRWPMLAVALPLLSIYALIASAVQEAVFGIRHWPASGQPPWPGPYVPHVIRRTAAVPLAFLGDALFRQEIAYAGLHLDAAGWQPELSPALLVTIVGSAFPFMIFVAGPRIAAGDALAWRPWIVRFLFFYGSVFISLVTNW
jgi:hypothetical protein